MAFKCFQSLKLSRCIFKKLMFSYRQGWEFAHSLICHERPEWIAHGRSLVMSDLSALLKVAHLSWVIWANRSQSLIWFERSERMSDEQMSEFPSLQIDLFYKLSSVSWHFKLYLRDSRHMFCSPGLIPHQSQYSQNKHGCLRSRNLSCWKLRMRAQGSD